MCVHFPRLSLPLSSRLSVLPFRPRLPSPLSPLPVLTHEVEQMIPFVIAMLGEAMGYAFRRVSADHLRGRGAALTWYLLQELFLILSPALMCASYCASHTSASSARPVTLILLSLLTPSSRADSASHLLTR